MRVYSWNVNGLRAVAKKGFTEWLRGSEGDVVALQEVRAPFEKIPKDLHEPHGYRGHFTHAERPGYSGVGLYTKRAPDEIVLHLGAKDLDCEARLQIARFGKLRVVNGYFPNGNGKDRDNSRIPFKLKFYKLLFALLEPAMKKEPILVMGDFNTAHMEIDLARPKENRETSGFTEIERQEFSRWIDAGWVDTFRNFEKGEGHYTWWSQRFNVRAKNIGWRIDYILASPKAMKYVKAAQIHPHVMGSDHCPISVDLDETILRAR
ncbi:MAG: exodeoxyribonuclease III [Sandaracinaceae bacterium]|nr:exodeoxyribonuclease III [Sandaracinaceae bacterium]